MKGTMQKRIGCTIIVSVGVALVNLAGSTAIMAANTPPSGSMTVVNTTANPVPVIQQGPVSVTGGITLSGTPNVNVANTPTVELKSGTAVKVSVDAPLPVAVQPQAGTPVRFRMEYPFTGEAGHAFYTVPAGKRLIISALNASCTIDSGKMATGLGIATGSFFDFKRIFWIPLLDQGQLAAGNGFYSQFVGSVQGPIFVDAGETLVIVGASSGNEGISVLFGLGTLVDAEDQVVDLPVH